MIRAPATAKINLALVVGPLRPDGKHDVATVYQRVALADRVAIEPSDTLRVVGFPADTIVRRALESLAAEAGIRPEWRARLTKRIPVAAGLGGGSSDAAVTFIGLQRLYKRPLAFERIPEVLRDLGSDVRFFTLGGRAAGVGRGDEVYKLDDASDYWVLLVDPGVMIATAEAYSWLTVPDHSNTIEGFGGQESSECAGDVWTNDFELPVFTRYPELAAIKEELISLGAYRAALSGSGSTVFGQFQMVSEAVRAGSILQKRFRVKLAKPLPRWEYFQRIVEE